MESQNERSVLIVDDSRLNRLVIAEYFKAKDFIIYEVEDGKQALDFLLEKKPDLILLDLIMPVMDGFEVMEALKIQNNQIPIIVITAYLKDNTLQRCRDLGCRGFLNKPVKMQELFQMISGIFDSQN